MVALWIMLKNVIVFVLLAVPGYLLVKGKILSSKESGVISKRKKPVAGTPATGFLVLICYPS